VLEDSILLFEETIDDTELEEFENVFPEPPLPQAVNNPNIQTTIVIRIDFTDDFIVISRPIKVLL
jgi:rRNA maturation protein Rpf1